MKFLFTITVSLLFLHTGAAAQSISYINPTGTFSNGYMSALSQPTDENYKFRFCQESKVGFGVTAAGIITGCVGIGIYTKGIQQDAPYNHPVLITGAALWLVGGVVAIMGSILCIDGSIHDMHKYYKVHKLSILTPEGNKLGLAYNF